MTAWGHARILARLRIDVSWKFSVSHILPVALASMPFLTDLTEDWGKFIDTMMGKVKDVL